MDGKLLSERALLIIRGKARAGIITMEEVEAVFMHLQTIEKHLDILDTWEAFKEDPEWGRGWRKVLGVPPDVVPDKDEVVTSVADLTKAAQEALLVDRLMADIPLDELERSLGIE